MFWCRSSILIIVVVSQSVFGLSNHPVPLVLGVKSPPIVAPRLWGNGSHNFTAPCHTAADCNATLPAFQDAPQKLKSLVKSMQCVGAGLHATGACSCPQGFCISRSKSQASGEHFFYCGVCGYIGSQCTTSQQCIHQECQDGFCSCSFQGINYDVIYCVIAFAGYSTLLSGALGFCVLLACLLLVGTVYTSARGTRHRDIHPVLQRWLRRRELARSQAHTDDVPPKYEEVIEGDELPTYDQALKQIGEDNPAFHIEENAFKLNNHDHPSPPDLNDVELGEITTRRRNESVVSKDSELQEISTGIKNESDVSSLTHKLRDTDAMKVTSGNTEDVTLADENVSPMSALADGNNSQINAAGSLADIDQPSTSSGYRGWLSTQPSTSSGYRQGLGK